MSARRNPRRASGHRRDEAVAEVKARDEPCWMCGLPVDRTLHWSHPWAFVVDELRPVSKGGSPYRGDNLATAHRRCNGWRKDRPVEEVVRLRELARARFGGWSTPDEFVARVKAVRSGSLAVASGQRPKVTTKW